MTPVPYTVEAMKPVIIARLKTLTIDGRTRPVLNGRPLTIHNAPLFYVQTRYGERSHAAQIVTNIPRIAVCACVATNDNTNAESEIDRLVNIIPATIETNQLSLAGVWNQIAGESWDVDDFEIAETLTRRLTWIFRITAKGARGAGL